MREYQPDYRRIAAAARNRETPGIPLYEHIICTEVMESISGKRFAELINGNAADQREYFRQYCAFYKSMGYDSVSFECCVTDCVTGGKALRGLIPGPVQTREDFERYPWESIAETYFQRFSGLFRAFSEALPVGMKGIGGVGNGVFEIAEDLVGYTPLCYLSADDPELYADVFRKIGELMESIWCRFLREFGDAYCVLRFGDDLGFKSNTLISADDIRKHVIPAYRRVIDAVHRSGKPFLLHSCGNIFSVMEDLLAAGIDAKHSNEDQIAPFPVWVEKYGDRIGNFGGIDTDAVCRLNREEMREYVSFVTNQCKGHGGFAFGSGNSIPDYVPPEQFLMLNEIIRELRGE